ncbi:MAG: multidrug efflux RND transporter permease subunit [Puniceicoccales bacterium]|nr:multidrug efflux RND transporter permease subunit [Puniceicoccales bacterium]
MARFFIDRPVFAWVIAIFLMIAGGLSITQLPIAQYPTIASPSVNIRVAYPGANAAMLDLSVTNIIGQELNGINGLRYYESSSEANGRATITATFEPGTNQDMAAVEIQNRIKRVEPRLPQAVLQQGLTIEKAQSGFLCMIGVFAPQDTYTNIELGDYVTRNIIDEIRRIPGVGQAQLFGTEKAMRIWVDPGKLAGLNLSVEDVNAAIRSQNVQITAGTLGVRPARDETQNTFMLTTSGQLSTPEEFGNILLLAKPDGSAVRLKDVARVELGGAEYGFVSRLNGKPSAMIAVQLTPTGNALETATLVKKRMEQLRNYFPRDAKGELLMDFALPFDTSPFISISIIAVVRTLLEAILLVFVVMVLFLQNIRYTFIPIIVVPVALLGAFGVLLALGFSINVLTMFGMVLVIGILVDDAIVVVENVERIMREELLPPREATQKAMKQITGAIIGMTLVLASVFVPMAFFPGAVGVIYRQFSLTMVASILFSALLALTLTPALCANLLKPHIVAKPRRKGLSALLFFLPDMLHRLLFKPFFDGFAKPLPVPARALAVAFALGCAAAVYFSGSFALHAELLMVLRILLIFAAIYLLFLAGNGFNSIFERFTGSYELLVRRVVRIAFLLMFAYAGISYGFVHFYQKLPPSFIPMEDQGTLLTLIQLPPNASSNRTLEVFKQVEQHYMKDPAVSTVSGVLGFSFAGGGENTSMLFISLKHWSERDSTKDSADKVAARANIAFSQIRDVYIAAAIQLPPIPELGISSGVDIRLQDRASLGHEALLEARNFMFGMMRQNAASANPVFGLDSRPDGLEDASMRHVDPDRNTTAAMGVPFSSISSTLGTNIGSAYVNDFPNAGRMQRVIVQADNNERLTLENLMRFYVRNVQGRMVPFSAFTKVKEISGATQLVRYNGYPTMRLVATPAPGRTTGEVMQAVRDLEKTLASQKPGFAVEWTKQALEEEQSSGFAPYLVAISLIFVFLLMAALYESWSIPLAVMLVVPIGAFGAVVAVTLRGMPNDIYFLIGMIAIIGLSTKNAILIIEFAKEQQLHGKELLAATVEGARLRFRPILMTSFAFILGVLPLFKASGAASASQRAIGTGVIGGMIAATVLGVIFIPAFYVVVRKLTGNHLSHYDHVRQDEWEHHTSAPAAEATNAKS